MKAQNTHGMRNLCWCLPGAEKQELTKWQSHKQLTERTTRQTPSDCAYWYARLPAVLSLELIHLPVISIPVLDLYIAKE